MPSQSLQGSPKSRKLLPKDGSEGACTDPLKLQYSAPFDKTCPSAEDFMLSEQKIAVTVPCYNEETQVGNVIATMPAFVDKIYIVDDCSKDRTSEVARNSGDPRVVVIRHEKNQSVGGAIATGYKAALADDFDVVAVMAGDGQMDPADLLGVCQPVVDGLADYVKGNRFSYNRGVSMIPKLRLTGNFVLSVLTKVVSGYWHVADTQCGYTAINKDALQLIDLDAIYPTYGCPNDILTKLNIADMRVADVPVKPVYHVGEQSKMRIPRVIGPILRLLVRLFFQRMVQKYMVRTGHPLVLAYFASFAMFLLGICLVIYNLALAFTFGGFPMPSLIAAGISFVLALQLLLSAFEMDFDYNEPLNIKLNRPRVPSPRAAGRHGSEFRSNGVRDPHGAPTPGLS